MFNLLNGEDELFICFSFFTVLGMQPCIYGSKTKWRNRKCVQFFIDTATAYTVLTLSTIKLTWLVWIHLL